MVQFIEQSGADVVPISYAQSEEDLRQQLSKVNGVIFDSKGISFGDPSFVDGKLYYNAAKIIFEYCKEMKDTKNESFPLFGIQQGILLFPMIVTNEDMSIIGEFFVANENRNIKWYIDNPA